MENGNVTTTLPTWTDAMATAKLESFLMFAKLRMPLSAKNLWKASTGTEELSSVISPMVNISDRTIIDLAQWLAQEIRENVALLHMADGHMIITDQQIEFQNDVHTYS